MYNEKLASKVMAFLGRQFPASCNFDDLKKEFSKDEGREDQWLSIMDALEKKGLIEGEFIRTGIDNALRAVYHVQLTAAGHEWLDQQGIQELTQLEELADRRFQRTARTIYEPSILEVRELVAYFSVHGAARSSDFCRAAAEAVSKQFALLEDAFVESYIGTLQETPHGVTAYREAWLSDKLDKIWGEELIRARDNASRLAQSTGFSALDVSPYAQKVMDRGRDLQKDIANEIRIAALMVHHTQQQSGNALSASSAPESQDKREKIFVIYGRDERLRSGMFAFLRSIGLKPFEWPHLLALTGKGSPYVGEVLDAAFRDAQAVVVLMTPDEEVRLKEEFQREQGDGLQSEQPRPNVLFEAGMAFAIQPERTILVQIGRVRHISDIAGRHLIMMDNSQARRQELAERLRTAGCSVNTTGTDWHSEGDLNPPTPAAASRPQTTSTTQKAP